MGVDFRTFGVPCQRSNSGPNIIGLHPEFRYLLWRALSDKRLAGSAVYSGMRSIAHQKKLYDAYLARGKTHPAVAPPGRSLHNEKPAGTVWGNLTFDAPWAIAADISFAGRASSVVDPIMESYGMHRIRSERWHWQLNKTGTRYVFAGEGSRGDTTRQLQTALNARVGAGLVVDGWYGKATGDAVAAFQQAHGLPVRRDWTRDDQTKLESVRQVAAPAVTGGDDVATAALRKIRAIAINALG